MEGTRGGTVQDMMKEEVVLFLILPFDILFKLANATADAEGGLNITEGTGGT